MSDALDPVLASLARLLVAQGVPFGDLSERLKGHYVQAGLALADGKSTDSRLSVMTGLQRRDIARLREFAPKPAKPNHLARLVALWQSEGAYTQNGRAIALPRMGDAPSFEALALTVRKDVHPRTMLDTLEAAGTIRIDGDTVHLVETAYLPLAGSEDQIDYLGQNVADHLSAASQNVLGAEPPFFERAVHYTGLTDAQVTALDAQFRAAQMALLEELNARASKMKNSAQETGSMRFRAGGYFYAKPTVDPKDDPS